MPRFLAAVLAGSLAFAQFPEITGSGEIKREGGSGKRGAGARQAAPSAPSTPPTTTDIMKQPPVVETSTPGAPRRVDIALRDRVTKFFQAHADGKFRLADAYVAEDSKDHFFAKPKTRYLKVWGHKVKFSDDFKKAEVATTVDMEMKVARIGTVAIRPNIPSFWRVEKGQWVWYYVKQMETPTPWGISKRTAENEAPSLHAKAVSVGEVLGAVGLSKDRVTLLGYKESTDSLKVTNNLPGEVRISIEGIGAPNLTVKMDKTLLKAGESATVEFQYKPADPSAKPTLDGIVRVEPLARQLPFQVVFDVPEEVKKNLPKIQ